MGKIASADGLMWRAVASPPGQASARAAVIIVAQDVRFRCRGQYAASITWEGLGLSLLVANDAAMYFMAIFRGMSLRLDSVRFIGLASPIDGGTGAQMTLALRLKWNAFAINHNSCTCL